MITQSSMQDCINVPELYHTALMRYRDGLDRWAEYAEPMAAYYHVKAIKLYPVSFNYGLILSARDKFVQTDNAFVYFNREGFWEKSACIIGMHTAHPSKLHVTLETSGQKHELALDTYVIVDGVRYFGLSRIDISPATVRRITVSDENGRMLLNLNWAGQADRPVKASS